MDDLAAGRGGHRDLYLGDPLTLVFSAGYAEVPEAFPVPRDMYDRLCLAVETAAATDAPLRALREAGRREAVRVAVERRKDALERRWWLQLRPLLRNLGLRIAHDVVQAVQPREAVQPLPPDPVSAIEQAIKNLSGTAEWQAWQQALTDAWREAQAEGRADAMAYLTALRGEPMGSFDLQFTQALDALRNLQWDGSETWMDRIAHGLAYEVGNEVADAIQQDASYQDLLNLIADRMGAEDTSGVLMLNQMLATGESAGSLAQYGDEGLTQAEILVSPGACDDCLSLEASNPWLLSEAAGELPAHPNCRCSWSPLL